MRDKRKFHELTLTRGTKRDVLLFSMPTYPDRLHLIGALAKANGRGDGAPIEVDGHDAIAVCWAALGLCWPTKLQTSFRGVSRDVVAYGEQVVTELLELGYGDAPALSVQGKVLYDWIVSVTFPEDSVGGLPAEVAAEAGFSEAPQEQSSGGAR
jgi:hypothetical protein